MSIQNEGSVPAGKEGRSHRCYTSDRGTVKMRCSARTDTGEEERCRKAPRKLPSDEKGSLRNDRHPLEA